jgi:hypothetical protein
MDDINQAVDLAIITQNLAYIEKRFENIQQFNSITPENVEKSLNFIYTKLSQQKDKQRPESSSQQTNLANNLLRRSVSPPNRLQIHEFDTKLVDVLITWTSVIIQSCFGKIKQDSKVFLELIQLFIDLLK